MDLYVDWKVQPRMPHYAVVFHAMAGTSDTDKQAIIHNMSDADDRTRCSEGDSERARDIAGLVAAP